MTRSPVNPRTTLLRVLLIGLVLTLITLGLMALGAKAQHPAGRALVFLGFPFWFVAFMTGGQWWWPPVLAQWLVCTWLSWLVLALWDVFTRTRTSEPRPPSPPTVEPEPEQWTRPTVSDIARTLQMPLNEGENSSRGKVDQPPSQ